MAFYLRLFGVQVLTRFKQHVWLIVIEWRQSLELLNVQGTYGVALVWQLFYASNIDIVCKQNQDSQMPTINYPVYLVYHYSTFYFKKSKIWPPYVIVIGFWCHKKITWVKYLARTAIKMTSLCISKLSTFVKLFMSGTVNFT